MTNEKTEVKRRFRDIFDTYDGLFDGPDLLMDLDPFWRAFDTLADEVRDVEIGRIS